MSVKSALKRCHKCSLIAITQLLIAFSHQCLGLCFQKKNWRVLLMPSATHWQTKGILWHWSIPTHSNFRHLWKWRSWWKESSQKCTIPMSFGEIFHQEIGLFVVIPFGSSIIRLTIKVTWTRCMLHLLVGRFRSDCRCLPMWDQVQQYRHLDNWPATWTKHRSRHLAAMAM